MRVKKLKSSFKKRKTRKRVRFSPDVRPIHRLPSKTPMKKKRISLSRILLKIDDMKTMSEMGRLYAKDTNDKITIHLKNNTSTDKIIVDKKTKSISQINFRGFSIHDKHSTYKHPKHKVKMKIDFGDVIWNCKKNGSHKACKRTDISWLNNVIKYYAFVKMKKNTYTKSSKRV